MEDPAPFIYSFVLPALTTSTALIGSSFLFEWTARQEWSRSNHISYGSSEAMVPKKRWKNDDHRFVMSDKASVMESIANILLSSVAGAASLYMFRLDIFERESVEAIPSPWQALIEFLVYFYLYDGLFFLIHYAFHTNDFLWKHCHAKHHQEHTPSAWAAAYGDIWEFLGNSGIPHIACIVLLRPHALVAYACLAYFCALSVYLHSGLAILWLDRYIFLGAFLPFRNTSRFHDQHHRFAGRRSRNMGLSLWIWDYLCQSLVHEA